MDYKDCQAFLGRIKDNFKSMAEDIVEEATFEGEREAKQHCPVDTGTLRASITSELEGLVGTVSTNVEYAPFVEYGTSKQRKQPFMKYGREAAVRVVNKRKKGAMKFVVRRR